MNDISKSRFKVLVSAFTCLPNRGSESGVAWNWMINLAERGVHVILVTQERNRVAIDKWKSQDKNDKLSNVDFIYVSLRGSKDIPFGIIGHHIYYNIWQLLALIKILKTGKWREVDIVHHLVYGGINTWSYLFLLPKPFMFGPVGGGELSPFSIVRRFGFKPFLLELVRFVLVQLSKINPILLIMQVRARTVLVKTPESAKCMLVARNKVKVSVEIGSPTHSSKQLIARDYNKSGVNIVFAGRLIYWKGSELLIDALELLDGKGLGISVAIVGSGILSEKLRSRAKSFMDIRVKFTGSISQSELFGFYRDADIFVFPSTHDSSGNVVLEAMSFGLPVVCLDLGGPPLLVGDAGIIIATRRRPVSQVSADIAYGIERLSIDKELRMKLSELAINQSKYYTWNEAVSRGYGDLLN